MRIPHRQPPQHQRIDQAEDCGVGANPERQGQDDDEREAGIPDERAEAVAHVPANLVEPAAVTIGADLFPHLFDAAELEPRQAPRLFGRDTVAHLLGSRDLDKGLQLVVEALFGPLAMEDPVDDGGKPAKQSHAPSRTLVIANAIRSQRRRCCSS